MGRSWARTTGDSGVMKIVKEEVGARTFRQRVVCTRVGGSFPRWARSWTRCAATTDGGLSDLRRLDVGDQSNDSGTSRGTAVSPKKIPSGAEHRGDKRLIADGTGTKQKQVSHSHRANLAPWQVDEGLDEALKKWWALLPVRRGVRRTIELL